MVRGCFLLRSQLWLVLTDKYYGHIIAAAMASLHSVLYVLLRPCDVLQSRFKGVEELSLAYDKNTVVLRYLVGSGGITKKVNYAWSVKVHRIILWQVAELEHALE
ncbi:hypothetical protein NPIL_522231 [Nephila pilipes]|uniref:Uncharacterized protein n=1 Tax=Nephila pilipes TaxID=299642 RepID=A0A8X6QMM7_NEPPI|nr:hypothetical protein NPIL_522231 [Nephila pilipes]